MVCLSIFITSKPGLCQERSQSREATGDESSDSTHVGETRYDALRGICQRSLTEFTLEAQKDSESSYINRVYSAWVERSSVNPEGLQLYFSEKPRTSKYLMLILFFSLHTVLHCTVHETYN